MYAVQRVRNIKHMRSDLSSFLSEVVPLNLFQEFCFQFLKKKRCLVAQHTSGWGVLSLMSYALDLDMTCIILLL